MSRFLFAVFFLAMAWAGCDRVDYRNADEAPQPEDTIKINPSDTVFARGQARIAFLLDFTGHTCGNCPRSHTTANSLEETYGKRLVIMAVHCDFFAEPRIYPDGRFAQDYRTSAGTELDYFYRASNAGLPKGIVDGRSGADKVLSYSAWAGVIDQKLAEQAQAYLRVSQEADGKWAITSKVPSALATDLSLTLYTTRDSIVSWQKNYDVTPNDIPGYVHRHMLRGRPAFVPTWVEAGQTGLKSSRFTVDFDSTAKPWRNHVIAVLQDKASKEFIQVATATPRAD